MLSGVHGVAGRRVVGCSCSRKEGGEPVGVCVVCDGVVWLMCVYVTVRRPGGWWECVRCWWEVKFSGVEKVDGCGVVCEVVLG